MYQKQMQKSLMGKSEYETKGRQELMDKSTCT